MHDYTKVALATFVIDIGLIWILLSPPSLCWFDAVFIWSMLGAHVCFYIALYYDYSSWISFLHYAIFAALSVSIFLKNTKLVGICLGLLILIQILWILESRCILNPIIECEEEKFGYGKELSIFVLLYTVLLAMKIARS